MISAFGVVHKSYTKMAPKLSRALQSYDPAKSTNLSMKLRHHAGVHRLSAGDTGKQGGTMARRGFPRDMANESKGQAKALNAGVGRMGARKRQLP